MKSPVGLAKNVANRVVLSTLHISKVKKRVSTLIACRSNMSEKEITALATANCYHEKKGCGKSQIKISRETRRGFSAGFLDTSVKKMQQRGSESELTEEKDDKKSPNLAKNSDDGCYKLTNGLVHA